MGYHITIKRESGAIRADELATAVRSMPGLSFDSAKREVAYATAEGLRAAIRLQNGEAWTKVAEPDVIRLMARLATRLEGRAFGDEGEWYSEDGRAHADPNKERERSERVNRAKRRRVFWNGVRMAVLVLVGYLIYRNRG